MIVPKTRTLIHTLIERSKQSASAKPTFTIKRNGNSNRHKTANLSAEGGTEVEDFGHDINMSNR